MNDLISKDSLLKCMIERWRTLVAENGEYDHYTTGFNDAIDYVEDEPFVDALPAFHARWDEPTGFEEGFWVCSACNFCTEAAAAPTLYKYCPNCGSIMDDEE